MTNKELTQIYYLQKEIDINEKRLAELRNILRAGDSSRISERELVHMQRLEDRIELLKIQLYTELAALQDYINNIQDSLVRMIITLRCVQCYSWDEVAIAVGGGNSYEGVKKIYYRYIARN